jgi:uncharacterized membrane protein YesL
MKRYLTPLIAGVIVFGAVTAFAATLNVSSKTLGSGNATVSSCNSAASVSYTTSFASGNYQVATLPITSAVGCANMAYKVTITGNGALATTPVEVTGTLDAAGAASPSVPAGVLAADVTGVSVVITG